MKKSNVKLKSLNFAYKIFVFSFVLFFLVAKLYGFKGRYEDANPLTWSETFSSVPKIALMAFLITSIMTAAYYQSTKNKEKENKEENDNSSIKHEN